MLASMAEKLKEGVSTAKVDLEIAKEKVRIGYTVYTDTRDSTSHDERPTFGLSPTDEITSLNSAKVHTSTASS